MSKKRLYSKVKLFEKGRAITYDGDARIAAFPLGGIGTGNVSVGARGELRDWEIFNRPAKGQLVPFSFFAIWARNEGEAPVSRILESRIVPPYHKSHGFLNGELAGLPRFEKSTMNGRQPFVYVDLEDKQVPVSVRMEAFTPFIPLDADHSGIPAAVIRYRITNPADKPVEVSIVGSMANVVGFDGYDVFNNVKLVGKVENEYRSEEELRGLYYTASQIPEDSFYYGSMALTTTGKNVIKKEKWLRGQWTDNAQDFWDDFSTDGRFDPPKEDTSKPCELEGHYDFSFLNLREEIGSVGNIEMVMPGEEKIFEFMISWYFPNRPKGWIEYDEDLRRLTEGGYDRIRNYYATKFSDAWDAAKYMAEHMEYLYGKSRAFEDALYATSLPEYIIDAVAANMVSLKSHCAFRIEDGSYLGWEGIRDYVGCGQGNVNHVWNYAQTVAFLFPELEITMRNVEFNLEMDEDGGMPFRSRKVLGESRWDMFPACDGQLGSLLRIYREWKYTGNDDFLKNIWKNAVRSMEYSIRTWDPDEDGILDGKQHVTYDIEFYGPNSMTSTIYLGALKGMKEMAGFLGEHGLSERYGKLYDSGYQRLSSALWTGEYYGQRLDDINEYRYQYATGCLTDQLLGQFMSHAAGLGYVIPKENAKKTLESIYRYNFRTCMEEVPNVQRTYALNDEAGLVLCSWPHEGRPRFPFAYCDEVWTGVEYTVAVNMIYEGMLDEAFTIVKSIRNRYDGYKRSPWSETEAGHHYIRAMSSFSLLTALSGFSCDVKKKTLSFDPKINKSCFTTFWITGTGWGTYTQKTDPAGNVTKTITPLFGDANLYSLAD